MEKTSEPTHYKKSTNGSLAKSGIPSLATTAGSDLGFVAAKTVLFIPNEVSGFVSEIV